MTTETIKQQSDRDEQPDVGASDATPDFVALRLPSRALSKLALCLSGGGYRAMLFHAGAILRLNELGVLSKV
jgi:predicted acylesterase/phospholipase RssA